MEYQPLKFLAYFYMENNLNNPRLDYANLSVCKF